MQEHWQKLQDHTLVYVYLSIWYITSYCIIFCLIVVSAFVVLNCLYLVLWCFGIGGFVVCVLSCFGWFWFCLYFVYICLYCLYWLKLNKKKGYGLFNPYLHYKVCNTHFDYNTASLTSPSNQHYKDCVIFAVFGLWCL